MILTIGYLLIQAFMKKRAKIWVLVLCALIDLYGIYWLIGRLDALFAFVGGLI